MSKPTIFIPNWSVTNRNTIMTHALGQSYDRAAHLLSIPAAHEMGYTGSGLLIGIIDDGYTPVPNLPEPQFLRSVGYGLDTNSHTGHGNLHMGVLAMQGKPYTGILPDAAYGVVKYLGYKGASLEDLAAAIDICIEEGCDIISISSGIDGLEYHEESVRALQRAVDHQIPVHLSVGNSYLNRIAYPANRSETLATGAIDYENRTPDFQNIGPGIQWVSFGVGVISTDHEGLHPEIKGSSFSNPIGVGCGGICMDKFIKDYGRKPDLTEYANILTMYCQDLTEAGWDQYTGHGLITIDFVRDNFERFEKSPVLLEDIVTKGPEPESLPANASGCMGWFMAILLTIISITIGSSQTDSIWIKVSRVETITPAATPPQSLPLPESNLMGGIGGLLELINNDSKGTKPKRTISAMSSAWDLIVETYQGEPVPPSEGERFRQWIYKHKLD